MIKNSGMTLVDVREQAFDTIQKLQSGTIDIKTAQSIKDLLNVINDTAKTQVAFMQSIPKTIRDQMSIVDVKAIAGTLNDRDAELDKSMHEIKENRSIPYQEKR